MCIMMNTFILSRHRKRSVTFEKGFSRIASRELYIRKEDKRYEENMILLIPFDIPDHQLF